MSVILSFVAFTTETGGVARRSGRKGGRRLRDLFVIWSSVWWLEVQGTMTES